MPWSSSGRRKGDSNPCIHKNKRISQEPLQYFSKWWAIKNSEYVGIFTVQKAHIFFRPRIIGTILQQNSVC
jgi:hypothetical protein